MHRVCRLKVMSLTHLYVLVHLKYCKATCIRTAQYMFLQTVQDASLHILCNVSCIRVLYIYTYALYVL